MPTPETSCQRILDKGIGADLKRVGRLLHQLTVSTAPAHEEGAQIGAFLASHPDVPGPHLLGASCGAEAAGLAHEAGTIADAIMEYDSEDVWLLADLAGDSLGLDAFTERCVAAAIEALELSPLADEGMADVRDCARAVYHALVRPLVEEELAAMRG